MLHVNLEHGVPSASGPRTVWQFPFVFLICIFPMTIVRGLSVNILDIYKHFTEVFVESFSIIFKSDHLFAYNGFQEVWELLGCFRCKPFMSFTVCKDSAPACILSLSSPKDVFWRPEVLNFHESDLWIFSFYGPCFWHWD